MPDDITLRLLGKTQILRAGAPVTGFISAKAQALLLYLAVTGRPHTREALAGLLWGEMPEAQASKNLRNVLSNLHALFGPHVHITREEVAFSSEGSWLDVEAFRSALTNHPPQKEIPTLQAAVELYQGDFLDGFYVNEAPAFEEWCLGQRASLKECLLQALQALVTKHLERGDYAPGIARARQLLALEPWREETHRQLMLLLARSRQRSAALVQYEICRRNLAQELGVEPLPETTALYERLKSAATPPPHNLPPQPTTFVGREAELAEITQFLNTAHAQILTLIGPGGIGKTRLAVQAAWPFTLPEASVEPGFEHGIFFVPLAQTGLAMATPSLTTALAGGLQFSFQGAVLPQAQLLSMLRGKNMLLLLDNFEHLVAEAQQLADLLHLAPGVKLIVTSRVRLNLREERVLEIRGLEYPASLEVEPETLAGCSAARLFVQEARRVLPNFALTAPGAADVARICQLVEGTPLGLELAASWLRVLDCHEIAREIAHGLDFLTSSTQNMPERHRSLRAVFDYSWNLLPDEEQTTFRQLSVFRGGFTREAAAQVLSIDLRQLAGLVDKSLLRRDGSGRYGIHDLLRQYADEKLHAELVECEAVNNRHCHYYADFMAQYKTQMKSSEFPLTVSAERENVGAAWQWAMSHRRAADVETFMDCL